MVELAENFFPEGGLGGEVGGVAGVEVFEGEVALLHGGVVAVEAVAGEEVVGFRSGRGGRKRRRSGRTGRGEGAGAGEEREGREQCEEEWGGQAGHAGARRGVSG